MLLPTALAPTVLLGTPECARLVRQIEPRIAADDDHPSPADDASWGAPSFGERQAPRR